MPLPHLAGYLSPLLSRNMTNRTARRLKRVPINWRYFLFQLSDQLRIYLNYIAMLCIAACLRDNVHFDAKAILTLYRIIGIHAQ